MKTITALVLAFLWAPVAHAATITCSAPVNGVCQVADTFSLEFTSEGQPLAVMNFGLFAPTQTPNSFQTICEESFGGTTPERIALSAGKLVIPGREGVFVNTDPSFCAWTPAKGIPEASFVREVVNDPLLPTRVWALVGAGEQRGLYVSEDQGASFTLRHQFARREVLWRLAILATTPRTIYAAGPGLVGPFALSVSRDDGQTFTSRDPVSDLADPNANSNLIEVSRAQTPRFFFSRFVPSGRDELWTSDDEGATVRRVLEMPPGHVLGGFSFGPTSETVYVGSRSLLLTGKKGDAVLFTSTDGGLTWNDPVASPASGPRFRCLKYREGVLYACGGGPDGGDSAFVSQSTDAATWTSVLTMPQVQAPPACMRAKCVDTAAWLCSQYGVCGPPVPDAGVDGGNGAPDSSGCSCRFGASQPSFPGATMAAGALVACRRRRKKS